MDEGQCQSLHRTLAGDRRKAAAYALAGAEQARRQSALEVAVNNYDIARRNNDPQELATRFRVAEGSAQALTRLGRYDAADDELAVAIALFDDPVKKAGIEVLRGEIAFKQGKMQQAVACYESAPRRLGCWIPKTSFGFGWGVLLQTVVQFWHSVWPGRLHRRLPSAKADLTIRLLFRLSHPWAFMNTLRSVWAHLATLNLAELYPPSTQLSFTYSFHNTMMAMLGWSARGRRYGDRAVDLARQFNDDWLLGHAYAYRGIGCVASARYEEGIPTLADALTAFERAARKVRTTGCVNSHLIVVMPELAGAIRRHADAIATANPRECRLLRKRVWRLTKWATRLSRLFPAIRPHALREHALILDAYGKTRKAWKCATRSCAVAEFQKAKYEHAQSLLVRGQLAKKLGRPEAESQLRNAEAAINEIERPLREMSDSAAGSA